MHRPPAEIAEQIRRDDTRLIFGGFLTVTGALGLAAWLVLAAVGFVIWHLVTT